MTKFRREHDSVGEMDILENAYYGANAKRAEENFPITGLKADDKFLDAMVEVKKAAAIENEKLDLISTDQKDAIIYACDKLLEGEYKDNFIVDPIQGGAGTSYNMNTNEIIANIANEKLGGSLGVYDKVHPNDDVNKGQSTNDVIPTSGKIALVRYFMELKEECEKLLESFDKKAKEFKDVYKMGRTQLQDAVPISLGQEFNAYHSVIKRDYKRMEKAIEALSSVNLGATAIGTGLNADATYVNEIVDVLKEVTGLDLKQAEDLVDGTQNLDGFLYASSILKTFAVSLSKISNDLRLMSSGPQTGIGDINLPVRQAGSSIMPGKINPVIPEVVSQVAFAVCGNDTTVTMAVEAGQLELNAFEPVIFYKLFESLRALKGAIYTLRINCIDGITANKELLLKEVEKCVGLVTALAPHIGYEKSSKIAHKAQDTGKTVRELVLEEKLLKEEELDKILDFKKMITPGILEEDKLEEK